MIKKIHQIKKFFKRVNSSTYFLLLEAEVQPKMIPQKGKIYPQKNTGIKPLIVKKHVNYY